MKDLIKAESQDDADALVERVEGPGRYAFDQIVAGTLPSQRAMNDSRGKGAISLVIQVPAALDERGRQIAMIGGDGHERTECRRARRRDHRLPNRAPG